MARPMIAAPGGDLGCGGGGAGFGGGGGACEQVAFVFPATSVTWPVTASANGCAT